MRFLREGRYERGVLCFLSFLDGAGAAVKGLLQGARSSDLGLPVVRTAFSGGGAINGDRETLEEYFRSAALMVAIGGFAASLMFLHVMQG